MTCHDETMKLMAAEGIAASDDLDAFIRVHCQNEAPPGHIVIHYTRMTTLKALLDGLKVTYSGLNAAELAVLAAKHLDGVSTGAIYAEAAQMIVGKSTPSP